MGFPLVDEPWIMEDQWVIKGYGHEVEGENYVTSPLPPRFFCHRHEVAGVCSRIAQPALHGNIFQSLSAALGALHPQGAHVLDEETFRPRTRPLFSTSCCGQQGWKS